MVIWIILGAFVVGTIISYVVSYLMLKPIFQVEAKILSEGRTPSDSEVGWNILNARAELVMIRASITILNGLMAALIAAVVLV